MQIKMKCYRIAMAFALVSLCWCQSATAKDAQKKAKDEAAEAAADTSSASDTSGVITPAGTSAGQSAAAVSSAKDSADRPGSVQAGIQSLADRLVEGLGQTGGAGFRRMAVLPFKTLDPKAKEHQLGQVSSELLASRLAREPQIIQVERSRLKAVINEIQRSERGELSPDGAVSVGKLLGANNVVLGSIAVTGPDYMVTARVVDSESGRVVTAADQIFPQQGMVALSADLVEVKTKVGAAIRSAILPGWGQIYNGDSARGIIYAGAFVGMAAGAVASAVLGVSAENDYNEKTADVVSERSVANDHYQRVNYLLAGMGVVWAIATADAYLTGRDATSINVEAAAVPTDGGGVVTLGGRF